MSKEAEQLLMFRGKIEDDRPLAGLTQEVNAHKRMKDPPRRRIVNLFALWVGKRRLVVFERLADAVFQGGLDEQTHRHHHQQRHDALGCFQREGGGEELRVVQETEPTLSMTLPLVAVEELLRRQLLAVKFGGGQDATTVLVDAGLSGRERRGQAALDLVDHLAGLSSSSRSSPFAIAGQSAPCAGAQTRGLEVLRTERKRLPDVGFARKGGPASCLQGLDFCGTLLAPLRVDAALGLRLAGLGVDQEPAWLDPTGGRPQLAIAVAFCE